MWRALRWSLFGIALCGQGDLYARTELLKTQPGSVVHWSRAVITVALDGRLASRSVPGDEADGALARAAQSWNAVPAQQPTLQVVRDGAADVSIGFCRGRWQGDTVDLGKSEFTASLRDGTVGAATVAINECDHRFSGAHAGGVPGGTYDLQAVLTHELGHVLGLGHSDNPAAIMYPTGGGASIRAPHLDDQTALALIYFGRSGWSGGAPAPPTAPSDAAQAPALARDGGELAQAHQLPAALPADSISLLSLKTNAGRSVMVYTCEPTLLPPMADAAPPRDGLRTGARHAVRKGGHPMPTDPAPR